MTQSPFFTVHDQIPREGPGDEESLARVLAAANVGSGAHILDAAAGPGGDVAQFLSVVGDGTVTTCDTHAPFVARVAQTFADDPRVRPLVGDMLDLDRTYDLIWCAGAIYFKGIEVALDVWRRHLTPGGHIAFSAPTYLVDDPSQPAIDFWEGCEGIGTMDDTCARLRAANFIVKDHFRLSEAAWDAYYGPLASRVKDLEGTEGLDKALADARKEIADWPLVKSETGYGVFVVALA